MAMHKRNENKHKTSGRSRYQTPKPVLQPQGSEAWLPTMNLEELARIRSLILNAVDLWLTKQESITRAIHNVAIETAELAACVPMEAFLITFESKYPDCWKDRRKCVQQKAQELLASEFFELSTLFSGLYAELNHHRFGGQLPSYCVRVMRNVPIPDFPDEEPEIPDIDVDRKQIAIQYHGDPDCDPDWMLGHLTRLMGKIRFELGCKPQS